MEVVMELADYIGYAVVVILALAVILLMTRYGAPGSVATGSPRPVPVPGQPQPAPRLIIYKCEIRTYVYRDGHIVVIHTHPACEQHNRATADPEGKYRGDHGRRLHPDAGIAEMRGGSHSWTSATGR